SPTVEVSPVAVTFVLSITRYLAEVTGAIDTQTILAPQGCRQRAPVRGVNKVIDHIGQTVNASSEPSARPVEKVNGVLSIPRVPSPSCHRDRRIIGRQSDGIKFAFAAGSKRWA